jgi:Tol biopolymer transport system component
VLLFKKILMIIKNIRHLFFLLFLFLFNSCNTNDIVNSTEDTRITVINAEPVWTPDGKSIIFIGGADSVSGNKLLSIDTNSANIRVINSYYGDALNISPDGQWVLFESGKILYKKRIGGDTATVQLTFQGSSYYSAWSRDGLWVAYDSDLGSGYEFWKMRSDGSQKRRISTVPAAGIPRAMNWFPDGIHLVVSSYLLPGDFSDLIIIDTAGNFVSRLTNDGNINDYNPKVSPDGQYITWWKESNLGTVFTIKVDGTELTKVLGRAIHPSWSPYGNMITYTNNSYGDGRIWVMNKDGTSRRKITY